MRIGQWMTVMGAGIAVAVLAGCAHIPGGIAPSSTPLEGRNYVVVGHSKATDSYVLLFGFIPIKGSNSTREALKDAVRKRDGDALINVTVESYTQFWILFTRSAILVEGDVIRFEDDGPRRSSRRRSVGMDEE